MNAVKALIQKAVQAVFRGEDLATRIALVCGHPTTQYETVSAFNDIAITRLPTNERNTPLYCGLCVTSMSCQCARCGRAIFVGDPVCAFVSHGENLYVTGEVFSLTPHRYVGCMRGDCAPLKGSRSGVWMAGKDGRGYVGEVSDDPDRYIEAMKSRRRVTYHKAN